MHGVLIIHSLMAATVVVGLIAGWLHTRNPAHRDPREEYRQLQRHAAWLEERLDRARRERWEPEMITTLSDQLGAACGELAHARGGVLKRNSAPVR